MSGCCEKNNRWLWEDGSQPIAILDRKLGHKYHYVRGTLTGRRLTTLRSISRQPTDERHVSAVSPDWLRPDFSARIQDSALIVPAGSVAFLEGGRGGKDGRQLRPPRAGANGPLRLLVVGSGRSTATGRNDRSCKTAVRHPCRQARAALRQRLPELAHTTPLLLARLVPGRRAWVGGRHEPSSLSSCL